MEIKITQPRKWGRDKTYSRELAGNWTDLDDSSRLFCLKELLAVPPTPEGGDVVAKIKIVKQLLGLPKSVFRDLSDDQLSVLVDKMDWLTLDALDAPLIRQFNHGGIDWFLPKALFVDGAAIEFPMADQFVEAFAKSGSDSDLLKVVGSLATPSVNGSKERQIIRNREDAEHRADILRGIPTETAMAVLLYFLGVKQYIAQKYGSFLFDDDDDDDDDALVRAATAHFPNFGWWGAYLGIAETGVFGNYEQVLHTSFHRVIMFLIEKRKEAKRQRAALAKTTTKDGLQ